MKYAFMSFSCPELSLDQMLTLASRLGYDGIEPRLASGHRHGVELPTSAQERKAIRLKAEERGVALCCLATSCSYSDPATAKGRVSETLECIELAADVGCARLRVFGGKLAKGLGREAAIELVTECLKSVAERAEARGVTVCLETHDDWCDPEHVAEVMRRVNRGVIAVNWDVMHPARVAGATMDQAFGVLRPWIRHLHVHDGSAAPGKLELKPIGQGDFDHRRVIQLLKASGYQGFLSGEWIAWEPYELHLPRELATLKSYEAQG